MSRSRLLDSTVVTEREQGSCCCLELLEASRQSVAGRLIARAAVGATVRGLDA